MCLCPGTPSTHLVCLSPPPPLVYDSLFFIRALWLTSAQNQVPKSPTSLSAGWHTLSRLGSLPLECGHTHVFRMLLLTCPLGTSSPAALFTQPPAKLKTSGQSPGADEVG